MIRNAVIHPLNEQPFLADLLEDPTPTDALLLMTNLRTLDGKRPVFVDFSESTFVFPYLHIRFIEIRPEAAAPGGPRGEEERRQPGEAPAADEDLEIDEDFLRRIREA